MTKRPRGFTLIELLIVVAIIGVLAAIAVPNFLNAQMRARVTRTYADLKALYNAMEMYRIDNNAYVPDYDSGAVPGVSISMNEVMTYAKLTSPVAYLASIPLDPFFIGSVAETYHPKAVAYFQYAGPHSGMQDPRPYWKASGTIYTITSLGPDKEDQIAWDLPHDQAYTASYNMSNGLTSKGDIYMSNHGLIL
jgi:type II secretion system protein G